MNVVEAVSRYTIETSNHVGPTLASDSMKLTLVS